MSIDPIKATDTINRSYLNYLATTFYLSDEFVKEAFLCELNKQARFVKGPILEATPPFKKGKSVYDLIGEKVLVRSFSNIDSINLPIKRDLYEHQELAIRKIIKEIRNVVVATGTGSGKTEIFLIPILNHLLEQKEKKLLRPGVRALLLYPMNALANDQLARLRKLLKKCPEITFGRYTGETETEQRAASEAYRKMYYEEPLPNELLSREEMWSTPPHILLTNYAMLEYLLLRPQDNVFFDGIYSSEWRFLVLDEVHTYSGAKGIEIAMLIRRLKERIVKSQLGRLCCVATSATLGKGKEDYSGVARFAGNLFGETFADTDIVGAARQKLTKHEAAWGKPDAQLYHAWHNILSQKTSADLKLRQMFEKGKEYGVPIEVLLEAEKNHSGDKDLPGFLYQVLKNDGNLIALQKQLIDEPKYLSEAAKTIFPPTEKEKADESKELAVALVDLAVKAKSGEDDQSLLPARYHVFVRAIEGAYISLDPKQELFLSRHEKIKRADEEYIVAELAACRGCGAHYIVGEVKGLEEGKFLAQPKEEMEAVSFFLLATANLLDQFDEDEEIEIEANDNKLANLEPYKICTKCGKLDKSSALLFACRCDEPAVTEVYRVPSRGGKVTTCRVCGRFSPHGIVKRFMVGTDAAASVLATSLYQQIKPKPAFVKRENPANQVADDWSSTVLTATAVEQDMVDSNRKLLIFSDSRQDAAFFAPYFNRTYTQILRRNLMIRVLRENKNDVLKNRWCVQDLVDPLLKKAQEFKIFTDMSKQEQINEVWKWIMHELLGFDRRLSLEGLGLVGFGLDQPAQWLAPKAMKQAPWHLKDEEVWVLMQVLLDSLRLKGVMVFPDHVDPRDNFFQPRNRELYVRGRQTALKKGILSWNSTGGRMNTRLDYLFKLAKKIDKAITSEQCGEVIARIWDRVLNIEGDQTCWQEYFKAEHIQNEGLVFRMKYNYWKLIPGVIDEHIKWYRCNKCNNLTLHNLKSICPSYRCEGTLASCDPNKELLYNHYRKLYLETIPLAAKAEEHTAQLTSSAAAKLQAEFLSGDVNILSCSTTFELGVDVGELEAVFMRNVPPSTSNYVQRAGRAGRRTDTTAFTLTYAQRRSHDLNHFSDPWRMVAGKIGVPHLAITNEKIVRRHMFAVVIAAFWQKYESYFGTVEKFFLKEAAGPALLEKYLRKKPEHLKDALARIVPAALHETLEIDSWGWVERLFEPRTGLLIKTEAEINDDIDQLQVVMNNLIAEHKPSDAILRLIKTLKRKPLLDYLSSHNIIPKYGFPVDVVELQIMHHSEAARRLQLQRDLRIALSEYAPSGEIVAGGKLWKSRYIRLSPRMKGRGDWEWERINYAICNYCHSYNRRRREVEENLDKCDYCRNDLNTKNKGVFIIPAYGFIASRETPGLPGEQRPEKTYSTRIYYSGDAIERGTVKIVLNSLTLSAMPATHGKMAIINNAGFKQFKVCSSCGYALISDEKVKESHPRPWGGECQGKLSRYALGHEFETDLVQLVFEGYQNDDRGFWFSLLYALLEGCSEALDIERQDIDGVLYITKEGDISAPALVLFDDVPGGAGHTHRVAQSDNLSNILFASLNRLKRCECGGEDAEASCYGCLRHYWNQFCHDMLNRRKVIDFLEGVLSRKEW